MSTKHVHHLGFSYHSHYGNEKRGTFDFHHVMYSGRGSLEPNECQEIFLTSIYGDRGLCRSGVERVSTLRNTCSIQNLKLQSFILNSEKPDMIVQNYSQGWESHACDVDRRSWDVHQWRSSFPHQGKRLLKLTSPQL